MQWLDRTLVLNSSYMCLCLTEADFGKVLKHLKVKPEAAPPYVMTSHSDATTHFFESTNKDGKPNHCAVVCLKRWADQDPIALACLLVHESVHIFQETCRAIGETNPSSEFEAYSIQSLSQTLMHSFVEQTSKFDMSLILEE